MSNTDEFWQYAKEAIISASRAETEDERHGLLDLARTWTQAALVNRARAPYPQLAQTKRHWPLFGPTHDRQLSRARYAP
jgi:hypothetical protein